MALPFAGREPDALSVFGKVVNLVCFREPFPVFVQRPHGQQNVGVRIAVAFVVDGKIRDHATGDELLPAVIADQRFQFFFWDFIRQCHDDAAGKLGVPLVLCFLNGIPKRLPICVFQQSIGWKENAFCQDLTGFIAVVFCLQVVLAEKLFAALVGGSGNGGLPFASLPDRY